MLIASAARKSPDPPTRKSKRNAPPGSSKQPRPSTEATQVEELESLQRDWTDQFGRLPDAAAHLLLLTEMKIRASRRGASSLEIRDGKLMVMKKGSYLQIEGKFPRLTGKTNGAKLKHALEWVKEM